MKVNYLYAVEGNPIKVNGKIKSPNSDDFRVNFYSNVETNKGLNTTSNPNSLFSGIVKVVGTNEIVSESHKNISFLIVTGLSVGFSMVTNFEIDSLTMDYNSILASGSGGETLTLILKKLNS